MPVICTAYSSVTSPSASRLMARESNALSHSVFFSLALSLPAVNFEHLIVTLAFFPNTECANFFAGAALLVKGTVAVLGAALRGQEKTG